MKVKIELKKAVASELEKLVQDNNLQFAKYIKPTEYSYDRFIKILNSVSQRTILLHELTYIKNCYPDLAAAINPIQLKIVQLDVNYSVYMRISLKQLTSYCEYEFGEPVDVSDLAAIPVAYTTTEDEKHEIQACVSFCDLSVNKYFDGKLVEMIIYDNLSDFVRNEIKYLNFDELVSLTDEQMKKGHVPDIEIVKTTKKERTIENEKTI